MHSKLKTPKQITPQLAELLPAIQERFYIHNDVIWKRQKTGDKPAGVFRKDRQCQQIRFRGMNFTCHQLKHLLQGE